MPNLARINRVRFRCNSNGCNRRFVVTKDEAGSKPRCPYCGNAAHTIEASRRRQVAKQKRCTCPNIPFPHAPIVGCENYGDLTPEQEDQYKAMILNTERSKYE